MSKKEWAEMRISGFLGWIHKIVMLITFPLRKFWYIVGTIIAIIAVIIIIPLCYGSSFSNILKWYQNIWQSSEIIKVRNHVDKLKIKAETVIDEASSNVNEKISNISSGKKLNKDEPVNFISWNVAKFNRVKYEQKSNSQDKEVAIKAPTFAKIKAQALIEKENKIAQEKQKIADKYRDKYYEGYLSDYYIARSDLGLEYLSQSEKLYDKVDIIGPNSLYIDGTFVFLYGIYTNPDIYDNEAAQHYLEEITKDQMVHCDVVAYTNQTQAATALCFVNGLFINKAMVENNLAKNVALK